MTRNLFQEQSFGATMQLSDSIKRQTHRNFASIDSTSLRVCHNIRIPRHLYADKEYLSQELADDLAKTSVTFITKKRRNMKECMQAEWDKFRIERVAGPPKSAVGSGLQTPSSGCRKER